MEVDVPKKSFCTQLITMEENKDMENASRPGNAEFLKPHIFTLTIPLVSIYNNQRCFDFSIFLSIIGQVFWRFTTKLWALTNNIHGDKWDSSNFY